MEVAPLAPKEKISESFEIKQNDNNYKLNLEIINKDITLNILDQKKLVNEYEIKLTLEQLQQMHKVFFYVKFFPRIC